MWESRILGRSEFRSGLVFLRRPLLLRCLLRLGTEVAEQQLQSAAVLLDPYTGEIKALAGGVGEKVRNFGYNE